MVDLYFHTSSPNPMRPEVIVMAHRHARKHCINLMLSKLSTRKGRTRVWWTVVHNPDWYSEQRAVDEALREEQRKRGLR